MLTPFSQRNRPNGWSWAADNGCFASRWNDKTWLSWLGTRHEPETAVFATVPDVVANHDATLARWGKWFPIVRDMGYRAAFVLQDGAEVDDIPFDDLQALFIGGTTHYKLSEEARRIVQHAKSIGKWVHMGRVNSARRIRIAQEWGCDSVDGTYLAFSPDANTPRLINMMNQNNQQMTIFA